MIEHVGAFTGDAGQRAGQIRIGDMVADLFHRAVSSKINVAAGRGKTQSVSHIDAALVGAVGPPVMHMRAHNKTGLGLGDRRGADIGPVPAAEFLNRFMVGQQRARRGDGLIAEIIDIALENKTKSVTSFAFQQVLPHCVGRAQRCLAVKVDAGMRARLGVINLTSAKTGNAAHLWVDHALYKCRGHRRVNSIAALHQHPGAGFRGLRLSCYNHRVGHVGGFPIVCSNAPQ